MLLTLTACKREEATEDTDEITSNYSYRSKIFEDALEEKREC